MPDETRSQTAALFDRLWWASFVGVLGFFIPFIELDFCGIVSSFMLAAVLRATPRGSDLRSAGHAFMAAAWISLAGCPATILQFLHPAFSLLMLPLVASLLVVGLYSYWKLLEGAAVCLQQDQRPDLATAVRATRVWGIVSSLILLGFALLALLIGVVIELAGGRVTPSNTWWVGFVLLPFEWLLGWLFLLRPLGWTRDALRLPAGQALP